MKALAIAAAILLVLLTSFLVIRKQTRGRPKRFRAANSPEHGMKVYLGLRNQALHAASRVPGSPTGPLAVLMDMGMSQNVATVVAYADGTASIYTSTGGGFIGGGQKYESIRKAGQSFIAIGRDLQPMMRAT